MCTNIGQILHNFFFENIVELLYKYCANIAEMLYDIVFFVVANIVNIAQISCKYLQILKKYCPTQIFRKYSINIMQSYISNIAQMI